MSSLWTPSGEHPVNPSPSAPTSPPPGPGRSAPPDQGSAPPRGSGSDSGDQRSARQSGTADAEPSAEQLDELRRQLAQTPAEVVVANHCYGLFELAAVYLSQSEPRLEEARLAIDALGFLVEGLADRLGEPAGPLRDALAQVRLAYVQIETSRQAGNGPAAGTSGPDVATAPGPAT